MPIPSYLKKYAADVKENCASETVIIIADSKGGRLFEIWYFRKEWDPSEKVYDPSLYAEKYIARSVLTGEEILLFDNAVHGYDNMFCIEHDKDITENRPLAKMDIPPSEIKIWLGYGIDYDSEKDIYDFNEDGEVILINNTTVTWEQLKTDGIDAIALYYRYGEGKWTEFAEEELA